MVNPDNPGQAEDIDEDVSFAALDLLVAVITDTVPPFSVVLTDWLSMRTALGSSSRPAARLTFLRSA